jgi:hypothetical protein
LIDPTSQNSTIHYQQVPGDEAGGVGGEEDGGASEFVELTETAHGRAYQKFTAALGSVQ